MDVEKQVAHWRESAEEELHVAREILAKGRRRQGLFWLHLALEKMLKAHVCQRTQQHPPKIHNLVLLAERAELELDEASRGILHEMNAFQVAGRYHDSFPEHFPDGPQCAAILTRAEDVMRWLTRQF